MKRIKFVLLLALALILSACSSMSSNQATPTPIATVTAPNVVIAQGRLEPTRYTDIALNASGLVMEVNAKEGDAVTAGEVIATLKSNDAQTLEEAQAKASEQLTTAYQKLRDTQLKLDNFAIPSDFKGQTPTEALSTTLDKLNAARDKFEPYRFIWDPRWGNLNLDDPKNYKIVARHANVEALEAKKGLDDAWTMYRKAVQWMGLSTDVENAKTDLDQALKDNNNLNDPSYGEDTAGVRAALANAEVRAPFTGVITNQKLKVGEFAASGQTMVTIEDTSNWVVKTTDLTEIDVVNVKEGQPVDVTLDAIPGKTFRGNVLTIGNNYTKNQGDIVYEVTVLLTDRNPDMRWGMTTEVKFQK